MNMTLKSETRDISAVVLIINKNPIRRSLSFIVLINESCIIDIPEILPYPLLTFGNIGHYNAI